LGEGLKGEVVLERDDFVALEYEGREPEGTGVAKSVAAMNKAMQEAMGE